MFRNLLMKSVLSWRWLSRFMVFYSTNNLKKNSSCLPFNLIHVHGRPTLCAKYDNTICKADVSKSYKRILRSYDVISVGLLVLFCCWWICRADTKGTHLVLAWGIASVFGRGHERTWWGQAASSYTQLRHENCTKLCTTRNLVGHFRWLNIFHHVVQHISTFIVPRKLVILMCVWSVCNSITNNIYFPPCLMRLALIFYINK